MGRVAATVVVVAATCANLTTLAQGVPTAVECKTAEVIAGLAKDVPVVGELYARQRDVICAPRVNLKKEVGKKIAESMEARGQKEVARAVRLYTLPPGEMILEFVNEAVLTSRESLVAEVTARGLNVRSGPSASSERVGVIREGERVVVLARDDGWARVQASDGTAGWVNEKFLSFESTPSRQRLKGQIYYRPPVVPIQIGIDTDGHLRVSISGEIVTPVGAFGVSVEPDTTRHLVVVRGNQATYFALERKPVSVVLENVSGTVALSSDVSGNVFVQLAG